MAARDEEICQRAAHEQAMGVFLQPAVAHLGEPKHALDDADRMLDPRFREGRLKTASNTQRSPSHKRLRTSRLRRPHGSTTASGTRKTLKSANDIATAVAIPANSAISKDRKRRLSQTAAMFPLVAETPLRTNQPNSRTSIAATARGHGRTIK